MMWKGSNSYDSKQRLKKEDLVMKVFYLISEMYELSDKESFQDIEIPMEEIRSHLQAEFGVSYNSNQWIYTQLRRYEEEIGVKLFSKHKGGGDKKNFSISVYEDMVQFHQKKHLYVSQKLKVANGVYDTIYNFWDTQFRNRPVRLLLGAGTTIYHLSDIFARKSWESNMRYDIYTHNLGSLQVFLNRCINYQHVGLSVLNGTIDPVTYTIVGENLDFFTDKEFDFIIQGTSCVHNGDLYIESHEERSIKETILKECRGTKILVLTKHEFIDRAFPDTVPYGSISDYDYIVVPRNRTEEKNGKGYELRFEETMSRMNPEIKNWQYSVYTTT